MRLAARRDRDADGAAADEASAFAAWAEVLLVVEELLGIATPGIPDGDVLAAKPIPELTRVT